MKKCEMYLASASPRRKELLEMLEISPILCPADVDENIEGPPGKVVELLAIRKARAALAGKNEGLLLAADTLVELGGATLGKPRNEAEAKYMLGLLSNNWHRVHTGICLIDIKTNRQLSGVSQTLVHMMALSKETIQAYIATGEPMDKAGAYGIQGLGGSLVDEIQGDYFTVMGLPLYLLRTFLEQMNVSIL